MGSMWPTKLIPWYRHVEHPTPALPQLLRAVASPGGWFSSHFSLPGGRYGDCGGYARRSVRLAIANVPLVLVARRQPASAPSPSHINLGADPSMLHTKPPNARPRQLLRDTHRTSTTSNCKPCLPFCTDCARSLASPSIEMVQISGDSLAGAPGCSRIMPLN